MDYVAILAALTQIAGPIIGQVLAQADRDTVLSILQQSRDEFGKIQVPKLKELAASLQQDTGLSKIQDDPQYRNQQIAADQAMGDVISSGGLTLADRAALNQIRNRTGRDEAARRHAIENSMAARGTLDSGAQLAMNLDAQQNAANSEAAAGEATAGQAQARAYQAILDRSRQAGEGLDRDWRQKSEAARAQDAINAGNTSIRNLTSRFNAGLPQQNFENELTKAKAGAGSSADLANFYSGKAAATGNMWAQGSKAAGEGIAAGFGSDESDWKKKYEELLKKQQAGA